MSAVSHFGEGERCKVGLETETRERETETETCERLRTDDRVGENDDSNVGSKRTQGNGQRPHRGPCHDHVTRVKARQQYLRHQKI